MQQSKGIYPQTYFTAIKYKFYSWGGSFSVNNIAFNEVTFLNLQSNALFYSGYTYYKWLNVTNCVFSLNQALYFMGAGWNSVFDSNVFDNTRVLQSNTNIGSIDCFIYSTPYVTNYQLWKNNTWLGTNKARRKAKEERLK